MQTLVSILTEGEEPKKPEKQEETSKLQGSVLDDQIVALMSGRPSEEIKNLKGKAEADPAGLLKSVGITGLPSGGSKIKNLESERVTHDLETTWEACRATGRHATRRPTPSTRVPRSARPRRPSRIRSRR